MSFKTNNILLSATLVAVIGSACDIPAQTVQVRESSVDMPITELVADCYLGMFPDEIDFARSLTASSRVRDRVCARWAQLAYDKNIEDGGTTRELQKGMIDDLKKEFPESPTWWLETLQNSKFDQSGCARFEFPSKASHVFDETSSKYFVVKTDMRQNGIPIPISDFSLGQTTGKYEALVRNRPGPGIEQIFVCTFDEHKSQRFNLWSFSNSGRIQWMQAIDFYKSSERINQECGPPKECRIEIVAHNVRGADGVGVSEMDVSIFAAWSNCLMLVRFAGEDGRAKFVFNTGLFPSQSK